MHNGTWDKFQVHCLIPWDKFQDYRGNPILLDEPLYKPTTGEGQPGNCHHENFSC